MGVHEIASVDRAAGACFISVHTRYARKKPIFHRTTDVNTHTHLHLKSLDRGPPVSGAEDSRVRVVIVMGGTYIGWAPGDCNCSQVRALSDPITSRKYVFFFYAIVVAIE